MVMLNEFLFKEIEEEDIGNIWFQQDGATCPVFEDRIISCRCSLAPSELRFDTVELLGKAVTVNGDRYRAMLNKFLFTKIEEEDIGNIWLQQDDATCHTVEATLDVLRPVFEDHIISCRADVVWPPQNCDLTPFDY